MDEMPASSFAHRQRRVHFTSIFIASAANSAPRHIAMPRDWSLGIDAPLRGYNAGSASVDGSLRGSAGLPLLAEEVARPGELDRRAATA